jgi:protein translocase SecG subunit
MMSFILGLLTVVLVLNSLVLILLILIQLPKKDAGAGIAFGGGATDALFGAGSGNALTKITKYSAGVFLGLSLVLSVMRAHQSEEGSRKFEEELKKKAAASATVAPLPSTAPPTPTNALSSTGAIPLMNTPKNPPATNAEAQAPATNAPVKPEK